MANGRNKLSRKDNGRDSGGFIAMPWSVVDSHAYLNLSHPARSLLLELARQLDKDNNGRLLLSEARLKQRGWNSSDVISRAKQELIESGLVFETVKGCRPNKASWYAVTWYVLSQIQGYDPGVSQMFERGAYKKTQPKKRKHKNAPLTPSHGVDGANIAPSHGVGTPLATPPHGAIGLDSEGSSTPSDGDLLDKPSAVVISLGFGVSEPVPLYRAAASN